jgi:cation diffusion facilitator family transporter
MVKDTHHPPDHPPRVGVFGRLFDWITHRLGLHQHDHALAFDDILESNARGIWAVQVSLIVLLLTATFEPFVVASSRSVSLLADTLHNFSDALTAIPLWVAYALNRRRPNRRYTYGYGRAEDLAGAAIVLVILGSVLIVIYESIQKVLYAQPLAHLEWVALAAVISFLENEVVAVFRLRVGHEIGSAALIADGWHAQADGITALGVLLGAMGVRLGWA